MGSLVMELYEAIAAASRRMLLAARAGDWEALLAAEGDCAALIERMRAQSQPAPLDAHEHRRRVEILRRMLADDAEIRARLHPWMEQLDRLLRAADRRRQVQRSYGD